MTAGAADPMTMVKALRSAVDEVDRNAAMDETFTVRDAALRDKQVLSVLSSMFGLFAIAIASCLALVGPVRQALGTRPLRR